MSKLKMLRSFEVDRRWLKQGIYVAEKNLYTNPTFVITKLDLRFTRPKDPREHNFVMSAKTIHTIEHLGRMYLRNLPEWRDKVIHFAPMGCRTGFILLLAGDYTPSMHDPVYDLVVGMCKFIIGFKGQVPDAGPRQCSNCTEHSLSGAKHSAALYLRALTRDPQFVYSKKE